MADTPRIDPDQCIVVDRRELDAAFDASARALDTLSCRQGIVIGLLFAAASVGVIFLLVRGPLAADALIFAFSVASVVMTILWRLWDASATWLKLGYWEVAAFAAAMKTQWEREADGGRADG